MRLAFLLITTLAFQSAFAKTVTITAELFDKKGGKKLYTYEGTRSFTGNKMEYKGLYKTPDGTDAVVETGLIENDTVISYTIDSLLSKEKGEITSKNGSITFKQKERNKKKKKKKYKLAPNTLVSANLVHFVQMNFDKILKKETVPFEYAVWSRREVIGFRFAFDKEDANTITISMTPRNLLYRSLVDPIKYTFDKKTKFLLESQGRVIPKQGKGRNWKSLDAYVTYKTVVSEAPATKTALAKKK